MVTIQVVYWFNPIIWYALKRMKQDCEMACHATALATLQPEDHKSYGQTIINLLQLLSEPYWVPGTLGFVGKYHKRRIAMISTFKKTKLTWAVLALALTLVASCSSQNNSITPVKDIQKSTSAGNQESTSILYKNNQFGFSFKLPSSWKGYSIVTGNWEGNDTASGKINETGTMISIRHPKWSSEKKRQDIPIMIFTTEQWNLLQQDKFHIGAAPVGPSELGQNSSYVFALPARYNYAFPTGYEEVEKILANHPLQTTQISADTKKDILLNMMQSAKLGKVTNCDFAVKTNTIQTVEQAWGKADETVYIAAAKGRYATFKSKNVVFGINKGEQIFEVRSFDSQLKSISLSKVKEVFGTPALDSKTNNQEIIGYTAGKEFKIEMVFPLPTSQNPDPVMDHYNVLYPDGTINSMANDPGREW